MVEPQQTAAWGGTARLLSPGNAEGLALRLDEPLSFWGGVDPGSGRIVDRRHPQHGASVVGRVLVLPSGRGSSSSSSVLAECIRAGWAPAAILLGEGDPILAVGALVAGELYGRWVPVAEVDPATLARIRESDTVEVRAGGALTVTARLDAQR